MTVSNEIISYSLKYLTLTLHHIPLVEYQNIKGKVWFFFHFNLRNRIWNNVLRFGLQKSNFIISALESFRLVFSFIIIYDVRGKSPSA